MIEIILRRDIHEFQPRPIFGRSMRELITYLVIGVSCGLLGFALIGLLRVDQNFAVFPILALGGIIGFVGLGEVDGMKVEDWLSYRIADGRHPRHMVYARPRWIHPRTTADDLRDRKERKADEKQNARDLADGSELESHRQRISFYDYLTSLNLNEEEGSLTQSLQDGFTDISEVE